VLFALTHSVTAGIITAVVFVIDTQLENHVLNLLVVSRTVKVNPLLVTVAVLVGAEIGNWIGGLFGGVTACHWQFPSPG
jgi:predicted PurR-regulated permease PerM